MELTFEERLRLFMALPTEHKHFGELKVIRAIRDKCWPTNAEETEHGLVFDDEGGVSIPPASMGVLTNIDFSNVELAAIVDELQTLERDGRGRLDLLTLYEKFVEEA